MRRALAVWLLHLADHIEATAYLLDDRAWTHRWPH